MEDPDQQEDVRVLYQSQDAPKAQDDPKLANESTGPSAPKPSAPNENIMLELEIASRTGLASRAGASESSQASNFNQPKRVQSISTVSTGHEGEFQTTRQNAIVPDAPHEKKEQHEKDTSSRSKPSRFKFRFKETIFSVKLSDAFPDRDEPQLYDWLLGWYILSISTLVFSISIAISYTDDLVCPNSCNLGKTSAGQYTTDDPCECSANFDNQQTQCGLTENNTVLYCQEKEAGPVPWYWLLVLTLLPLSWCLLDIGYNAYVTTNDPEPQVSEISLLKKVAMVICAPVEMLIGFALGIVFGAKALIFNTVGWLVVPWIAQTVYKGDAKRVYFDPENNVTHFHVVAAVGYNDDYRFFVVWIFMVACTWVLPFILLRNVQYWGISLAIDYLVVVALLYRVTKMRLSKAILLGVLMTHILFVDFLCIFAFFVGFSISWTCHFLARVCRQSRNVTSGAP